MALIDDIRALRIADYDYDLPDERIAKHPLAQREQCKLLYYKGGDIQERKFWEVPSLLTERSTLIYNNTRVMHVSRMEEAKPENSYQPYQAYIYNGRYPIVRTVYALLNDPRRGLPWGFAHFIESYKGQLIIKKSGILPIIMDTYVIDVKVNQ